MSELKEDFGDPFTPDISDIKMEKVEVNIKPVEDNGMVLEVKKENDEVRNNNKMDIEMNQVINKDNYMQKLENKEEIKKIVDDENMNYSYKEKIKTALDSVAIDSVAKPGTFACGGVLENAKLQLSVEGVGYIHLPLSSDQGEVLKNICTAAPFGRGSETLVHKSVRDAWQVDGKDVTLDTEFNNLIKEKVAEIIPTLMGEPFLDTNLCSPVESELYKLVYYEEGGHFLAHRDTEKVPGMFATLVIQLPAGHRGGGLVVWHKEDTKVFEFNNESNQKFFFTAFFADCEHELRSVTSGRRLVLIYNLFRKNTHSTFRPNNDDESYKNDKFLITMKKAVEEWKSDKKGPNYLALKFDYLYSKANMSFQNLKGKDKIITDALCSFADIEVCLATLTKTEKRTGYNDHDNGGVPEFIPSEDEEEQEECSYTLTNWMGVNDSLKHFGKVSFSKNEMLIDEKDMFPKGEHTYEEKNKRLFNMFEDDYFQSEFTYKARYWGNEGCSVELFYKKTVIVFFPKSHKILITCENNLNKNLIDCKKLTNNKHEDAFDHFQAILLFIETRHEKALIQLQENDNIASILEMMILFENKLEIVKSLANKLLVALVKPYKAQNEYSRDGKKLGIPTINSAIALDELIKKLGWESLGSNVLELVKECAVTHTITCAQLVRCMLSHGLHNQATSVVDIALSQFSKQSNTLSSNCWSLWAVLLASHDTFSLCFDAIIEQISKLESNVMIKIISEMYGSLKPNILNQSKIKQFFQNILTILKDNDWKNLSVESATLVWPSVFFVDEYAPNTSPIHSLVQKVIEHEDSSHYLSQILKLGFIVKEKDNPSVQLMVKKRLEQLNNVTQPVFSWAQSNATLVSSSSYYDRSSYGGATGPETKSIENFLRGNQQSMSFGGFQGKRHADSFGRKYFPDGSYNKLGNYSARHEVKGVSKKVQITIVKTRDLFEAKNKEYTLVCTEVDVLKKRFCEPKKTVAQKRSRE